MKKKLQAVFKILSLIIISLSLISCNIKNYSDYNKLCKNNIALGLTYLQLGNKTLAKEKLLRALEENPKNPIALNAMAYFWEKTDNNILAEEYYRRAYQLAPQDGAVLNNYGVFLCKQQRYTQAQQLFMTAENLQNYINTSKVYENAGLCALKMNDKAKAKDYFTKALVN